MQHSDVSTVDESEPNNLVMIISLIVSFVIFVHIVYFCILYYKSESSKILNIKQQIPLSDERLVLERYERETLQQYSWINKSKGIARVPVDVAAQDVIRSYR